MVTKAQGDGLQLPEEGPDLDSETLRGIGDILMVYLLKAFHWVQLCKAQI